MIELSNDRLTLRFSETHPDARLSLEFQRTLRIPEAGAPMPNLPSLGRYPVYAMADFRHRVPEHWLARGGAMLPMYQSEAMWLSLQPAYSLAHHAFYPIAVKIRIGPFDAVRGGRWAEGLNRRRQDHLVIHEHCWLGGFQTARGVRQFVAMPLGTGYQPDEDARLSADRLGYLEIVAYPMSAAAFEMRFPRNRWQRSLPDGPLPTMARRAATATEALGADVLERRLTEEGLFPFEDWEHSACERYHVHLANSLHWCAITGSPPPMSPLKARPRRSATAALTELLDVNARQEVRPADQSP